MKAKKSNSSKATIVKQTVSCKVNLFKKLMDDKNHMVEAIKNGKDLSTLKDITFGCPL